MTHNIKAALCFSSMPVIILFGVGVNFLKMAVVKSPHLGFLYN